MDPIELAKRFGSASMPQLNSTEPINLTDLPANILEAVIPGYSIISRYILLTVGFDISLLVSVMALIFAGSKACTWLWTKLEGYFTLYFMSSVHIDDSDDLYDTILQWIAEQYISHAARSIKAKSARGSAWDEEPDETASAIAAVDADGLFNYGEWQAKVPPRYEPYYGRHRFWHKGRFFVFHRSQKQRQTVSSPWGGNDKDDDLLELSCIGRSTAPIKSLLQEIKLWTLRKQLARTTIKNPTSRERQRFRGSWAKTSSRPSRPMSTVILDEKQKAMIQRDMNEFLHPSSPKWYATRGIPYRRGYLFKGPPGTGKTSLSFALAGIFGLEIHCLGLNDPELSESDIMHLFNGLPRRCIVLLEDIDEAGIKRDDKSDEEKSAKKARDGKGGKSGKGGRNERSEQGEDVKDVKDEPKKEETQKEETKDRDPKGDSAEKKMETSWTLQDLARALKDVASESSQSSEKPQGGPRGARGGRGPNSAMNSSVTATINTGISLSGLLNAIDGVATHEGRILIMTTNHPEKLDAALIRSGRVDMQIAFTYAKRPQIKELFMRMYAADLDVAGLSELDLLAVTGKDDTRRAMNGHAKGLVAGSKKTPTLDVKAAALDELENISTAFAGRLPDEVFAPSDIQGFLLLHKKAPRLALEKVEEWRDEQLAERKKKEDDEEEAAAARED